MQVYPYLADGCIIASMSNFYLGQLSLTGPYLVISKMVIGILVYSDENLFNVVL